MILEAMKSAAVSALVSSVISGIGVFYLQRYLNDKHRESEQRAAARRESRRKADILEVRRRRAAGRLLFWLHFGIVRGAEAANGDLESAWKDYIAAEEAQKQFEQEQLADHTDENRGGG